MFTVTYVDDETYQYHKEEFHDATLAWDYAYITSLLNGCSLVFKNNEHIISFKHGVPHIVYDAYTQRIEKIEKEAA